LGNIYRGVNDNGDMQEFAELAEEIEEHDAHYRVLLQQRKLATSSRRWQIEPAGISARDTVVATVVSDVLNSPEFSKCVLDLLDGIAKGYSVVEIVWAVQDGILLPVSYDWVDARLIVFSREDGKTPLIITDNPSPAAEAGMVGRAALPLSPAKFISHTPQTKSGLPGRGGIAKPAMMLQMLKGYAVRDWWAFIEVFGLPTRIGKYGPEASDDDIDTLVTAVSQLASDAGCVIPASMEIEFIQTGKSASSNGHALFEASAKWCDSQLSKLVLGGTMTADDGSSLSQAQIHYDVREDLVEDDAQQLAMTVLKDLVRWIVGLNFDGAAAPKISLPADDNEDALAILDRVERATNLGLTVNKSWLQSLMALPLPKDDDDTLIAKTAPPETNALNADEEENDDYGNWMAVVNNREKKIRDALKGAESPNDFVDRGISQPLDKTTVDELALQRFARR
jgi:phage gp29-like protein